MVAVWVKRWLLVAVGVPVVAWLVDKGADVLEERRGSDDLTAGLHGAADKLRAFRGRRR